ncbi:MAG: transporter permease [Glaciihabitans sp.]|nr:transporter permease [Glaciihabitans sp.]
MIPIALSELKMLVRNRLVLACAVFIPLAFGAFLLFNGPGGAASSAGAVTATLQITMMIALGVYVTCTTTLAARRQTLMLKRLRSGATSDLGIIAGLVLPVVVVSVIQVALVTTVLSFTATAPENAPLLIVAILLTEVMFVGFALATAGVTNSPEHAQVTTLPLFFVVIGVAIWVIFTGTADLTWVKRLLPGGGIAELIGVSWNGGDLSNLLALILPSVLWAGLALYFARRMFKWEPRS